MMRKSCILIFLLMAFASISPLLAEESTTKVFAVNLTDGTTIRYIIAENPRLTFDEENVYVQSDVAEAVYARSEIQTFTFEDYSVPSSLDDAEDQNEIVFRYVARNLIEVTGDIQGASVRVYAMSGQVLQNFVAQGSLVQIDLTDLAAGIYIININSRTLKVYKK